MTKPGAKRKPHPPVTDPNARCIRITQFAERCGVSQATISGAIKDTDLGDAIAPGNLIDTQHPMAVAYLERHGVAAPTPGTTRARVVAWLLARPEDNITSAQLMRGLGFKLEEALGWLTRLEAEGMLGKSRGGWGREVFKDAVPAPLAAAGVASGGPYPGDAGGMDGDESMEKYLGMELRDIRNVFGSGQGFSIWLDNRKKTEDIRGREISNAAKEGEVISRDLVRMHIFGALETFTTRLLTDTPKTLAARGYAMANSGKPIEDFQQACMDLLSLQLKISKGLIEKNLGRIKA